MESQLTMKQKIKGACAGIITAIVLYGYVVIIHNLIPA